IDGGDVAPKLTPQQLHEASLAEMHRSIKNGRPLAKRRWMLQRAPDSTPFHISDNPVAMVNYLVPHARHIDHPDVELYLPNSSRFSLHILSDAVAMTLLAGAVPEAREQAEALRTGAADQLSAEHV